MIKTTGRYLLLGAGWTSNFGAPLARQMWSMILGALPADAPGTLRASLRNNLDFEELYGDVMDGSDHDSRRALTNAIEGVYRSIDRTISRFTFSAGSPYPVNIYKAQELLAAFAGSKRYPGFIFTLNQDLFLERQYYNGDRPNIPGLRPHPDWFQAHFRSDITPEHIRQVPSAAQIEKSKAEWMNVQRFHYVKLHGSCNWVSATNSHRMVLGRAKEKQILEEPLLRWYFDLFRTTLTVTGSRLLVIGYGFRDAHVNAAIADAGDLRVFVMSPQPPEQFRSELRQQPNGDRIWDRIDDYYETSLAQLFPADQSITEMWDRVQMAFFERRLKWQDP